MALTSPSEANLVRAGGNGEPMTDGPFPEAKEFLAGCWIVDVGTEPARARKVNELQGNVSSLLGELLGPRGAKRDEYSER